MFFLSLSLFIGNWAKGIVTVLSYKRLKIQQTQNQSNFDAEGVSNRNSSLSYADYAGNQEQNFLSSIDDNNILGGIKFRNNLGGSTLKNTYGDILGSFGRGIGVDDDDSDSD